jgi:hypothetical protein
MKKLLCVLLISFIGCVSPTPHDLTKETKRAGEVTVESLYTHATKLQRHYEQYGQVEGIIWSPRRSDPDLEKPDSYGNGGDSAIFTGFVLASSMYRYCEDKTNANMAEVIGAVRGLHILTHVAGPGVIARCAFPLRMKEKFQYPDGGPWPRRIEKGFVGESAEDISDPWGGTYPKMVYYTRATKYQLTGVLFGLSVVWAELEHVSPHHAEHAETLKKVISEIVESLYSHIKKHDFKIRDAKGNNDTNADSVSGTMETQLLALYRKTTSQDRQKRIQEKYEASLASTFAFENFFDFINVFNNYSQYFAWNLRYTIAYSIWILEENSERIDIISNYVRDSLWAYTSDHKCPYFTYIYASMMPIGSPTKELKEARLALKSLSLKPIRQYDSPLAGDIRTPSLLDSIFGSVGDHVVLPHLLKPTDYFTWSKRPWDVGTVKEGEKPISDTTGLSFLLPYWMGKHGGFITE